MSEAWRTLHFGDVFGRLLSTPGGAGEAAVILVIVVLNGLIGFYQELSDGRAIEALQRMTAFILPLGMVPMAVMELIKWLRSGNAAEA